MMMIHVVQFVVKHEFHLRSSIFFLRPGLNVGEPLLFVPKLLPFSAYLGWPCEWRMVKLGANNLPEWDEAP